MTLRSNATTAGAAVAMIGCQTLAGAEDWPARITNPTDQSRAALQGAINDALNVTVALADDALTDSSVLTIERSPPRSMQGLPAQGRNMDTPLQFRLVLSGSECILIDQRDNSRYLLEQTTCTPLNGN